MIRKYAEIFCWKNVSSFCSAVQKLLTFFSAKNISILYIESAKIVNEMTLKELVKLTTLWTTGPWSSTLSNFMCQKITFWMANSADYNQTAPKRSSLIIVCTICTGTSVQILRVNTISPWRNTMYSEIQVPFPGDKRIFNMLCIN